MSSIRLLAMTLAATGLLLAPTAQAQDKSPGSPAPMGPETANAPPAIPESKLDATAAAIKEVSVLKDTFEEKLGQAPVEERQRIVGEANEAMAKAVTDKGLSVEEYLRILKVAQDDQAIRDKLIERIK